MIKSVKNVWRHLTTVNTQLPTAEDGVGLLWNIQKLYVSVEDQF